MRKNWIIYRIDSPSGKIYIGKTSRFNKRMSYYKKINCGGQTKLFSSLQKHGFDNHVVSILDEFKSDSEFANGKEMFWIRSFMSNYCKWPEMDGLNLTDGGEGTAGYKASEEHKKILSEMHKANPSRGMKGKKVSDHTKGKIIEAMILSGWIKPKKPKPTKEETRLKMSLAKKGKPAYNKGKPMPEHQKELLRRINTGRPSWNKGKDYSFMSAEERKLKFGAHNIGNQYNKGRKHKAA